jgi:hypothetical protein
MISEPQFAQIITFFLVCAGLVAVVRLWHAYHTDLVRAELFALRDEMFLYAVDNKLLDSEAYQHLRNLMNGLIRYAHRLSAGRLLILSVATRLFPGALPQAALTEWRSRADLLPKQQKDAMYEFHRREGLVIASHLANRSLILKMALHAFSGYLKFWDSAKKGNIAADEALNVVADHMPLKTMESEASCV